MLIYQQLPDHLLLKFFVDMNIKLKQGLLSTNIYHELKIIKDELNTRDLLIDFDTLSIK